MNQEVTVTNISPKIVDYSSNNLNSNKNFFIDRLWRTLFKIKLDYMRYDITVDDKPLKALRREDNVKDQFNDFLNISEARSLERISLQTKAEVIAIANEIFNLFSASKKVVYSSGINHPTTEYAPNEDHEVKSDDYCGIKF